MGSRRKQHNGLKRLCSMLLAACSSLLLAGSPQVAANPAAAMSAMSAMGNTALLSSASASHLKAQVPLFAGAGGAPGNFRSGGAANQLSNSNSLKLSSAWDASLAPIQARWSKEIYATSGQNSILAEVSETFGQAPPECYNNVLNKFNNWQQRFKRLNSEHNGQLGNNPDPLISEAFEQASAELEAEDCEGQTGNHESPLDEGSANSRGDFVYRLFKKAIDIMDDLLLNFNKIKEQYQNLMDLKEIMQDENRPKAEIRAKMLDTVKEKALAYAKKQLKIKLNKHATQMGINYLSNQLVSRFAYPDNPKDYLVPIAQALDSDSLNMVADILGNAQFRGAIGLINSKSAPRLIKLVGAALNQQPKKSNITKLMEFFCWEHRLLQYATASTRNTAFFGGERSYAMMSSLARLEKALMKWTINELVSKHHFTPVTVPNILHNHIIERCGFPTESQRSQVYKIAGNNQTSIFDETPKSAPSGKACLAGTSEFSLASIHIGETIPSNELPKRYCALSRCYRAETSKTASEWALYRVHYFNKVEMFALTMPNESYNMLEEFLAIQESLFSQLGLHFQVLDMPQDDLGLSAKKKYDIEAWMEARQRFGEISSTSNCEDYQSSRLNVKYSSMIESNNQLQLEEDFVHTVNGTACSSVRTMIALIEQNQTPDGRVQVPKALVPYMNGTTFIPDSKDAQLLKDVRLPTAINAQN